MSLDRTIPPAIRPFCELKVPLQRVDILPNGLQLHSFSGGDQPVCRIQVYIPFDASAIINPALPKLLPAVLPEGCATHSAEEIDSIFDFCGTRIGGRAGSRYFILELSLLTERCREIIPLIADILAAPSFEAERLASAKSRAIATLLTARRQPSTLVNERLCSLIFGSDHTLARTLEPEMIEAVERTDLTELYARVFAPQRMHVFISGLLDDSVLELSRREFGRLSGATQGEILAPEPYKPAPPCRESVAGPESFQSAVSIGIPVIGRSHADYVPLRLSVMALGGYFGSRLMSNIREEKGLTYHIGASLLGDVDGAYVNISALCDKSYTGQVVSEIESELRTLASNPPSGEELERLRLHAMTDLVETLDSPWAVMSYYTSQVQVGTPDDYFEAQLREIKALSPEKIAEMAEKYLGPDMLRIVTSL